MCIYLSGERKYSTLEKILSMCSAVGRPQFIEGHDRWVATDGKYFAVWGWCIRGAQWCIDNFVSILGLACSNVKW